MNRITVTRNNPMCYWKLYTGLRICSSLRPLRSLHRQLRHYSESNITRPTFYTMFPNTFPTGPPPNGPFIIDASKLRQEFLKLQSSNHPDKLGGQASHSADINIAYKTMLDPLLRAQHLLLCQGIDALAEKESLVDEDLLMEVLMARESIEEAASMEELEGIKTENDGKIAESEKAIDKAFHDHDLQNAKQETIRLSYWTSINNQLDKTMEEMEELQAENAGN